MAAEKAMAAMQSMVGEQANMNLLAESKGDLIKEHYAKASNVCGHIDEMVSALAELYNDNAKWKQKYINAKKSHFSKFFGASSTMLIGNTFREWKRFSFECDAARKLVHVKKDLEIQKEMFEKKIAEMEDAHDTRLTELEAQHQQALADLQAQFDAQTDVLTTCGKDKEVMTKKAEKLFKVMTSIKGQLSELEDVDPNSTEEAGERTSVSSPSAVQDPTQGFDYLKHSLHELLNQIDPKYVPPLGSLSLMPPPPAGFHGASTGPQTSPSYAPAASVHQNPTASFNGHSVLGSSSYAPSTMAMPAVAAMPVQQPAKTLQAPGGLHMPGLMQH